MFHLHQTFTDCGSKQNIFLYINMSDVTANSYVLHKVVNVRAPYPVLKDQSSSDVPDLVAFVRIVIHNC